MERERAQKWTKCLTGSKPHLFKTHPCEKALSHRCLYLTLRRRPGKVIGDYIVREQRAFRQLTEALRRPELEVRNVECNGRDDHRATSVNSTVYSESE